MVRMKADSDDGHAVHVRDALGEVLDGVRGCVGEDDWDATRVLPAGGSDSSSSSSRSRSRSRSDGGKSGDEEADAMIQKVCCILVQ